MVSVIIPYYQRPEKIRRCVDSVLKQSYQDFEILIIDDKSPIPLILDNDSRISVYRNNVNLGPGLSRNVGLDHASGSYIAFLDSDDYWEENFLSKSLKVLEENDHLAFVYSNTMAFNDNGTSLKRKQSHFPDTIFPNLLHEKRSWATSACLWSKNAIGNIRYIDARNWEDYVFDTQVSLTNNNIMFIPEVLCYYDQDGEDKLSNSRFYFRLQEKSYALIRLFDILQAKSIPLSIKTKDFFKQELLTALEFHSKFDDNHRVSSRDILSRLRKVDSFVSHSFIKLIFLTMPERIAYSLINKIKKRI